MLLDPHDVSLFFRLHRTLMFFVNRRLKLISGNIATPEEFASFPVEARAKVHHGLNANLDLIDAFADENPAHLPADELEIIRSWRHLIHGRFIVFRQLAKYTVFLKTAAPAVAYGVVALSDPFEDFFDELPVMVETALLPFRDKIVYDGMMNRYGVSFGPGIRRSLNEDYKEAKARQGIVTSLPMSAVPLPPKEPKSEAVAKTPSKEEKDESLRIVVGLVDQFCKEHLNEEYAVLCGKLVEKLERKRPSPLLQGSPNVWASGIVRAIGSVNFLHDKTQTPSMPLTDIDRHFGVSPSSGAAKSSAIRKMFKMYELDPDWSLPSMIDDNPMVWMFEVNGFIMDLRQAPRDIQEMAFNQGLIPYIPADRQREEASTDATS